MYLTIVTKLIVNIVNDRRRNIRGCVPLIIVVAVTVSINARIIKVTVSVVVNSVVGDDLNIFCRVT